MKKTLIALMATAFCAMGVTLEDAATVTDGNATVTTTGTTDFTVALTLDVAILKSKLAGEPAAGVGYTIVKLAKTSSPATYTGVNVNTKDNDFGLWGMWGTPNSTPTYVSMDGDVVLGDLNGGAEGNGWEAVAYAGMVYTHALLNVSGGTKSHTYAALTLFNAQGEKIISTYYDASGLGSRDFSNGTLTFGDVVTKSYLFNTSGTMVNTEAEMQALARAAAGIPAIPEPATATLSLLALAGLAMRRRRK